jgi:hypothetical protein
MDNNVAKTFRASAATNIHWDKVDDLNPGTSYEKPAAVDPFTGSTKTVGECDERLRFIWKLLYVVGTNILTSKVVATARFSKWARKEAFLLVKLKATVREYSTNFSLDM